MKKIISSLVILSLVFSMSLWTVAFAADEVLINDSFENGIGEWNYTNDYAKTNISIDTTTASDGKASLLFNDDTAETSPILKSKYMDSVPGDEFTMSADFKLVEASGISVFYKFYDANDKQLTGSGSFNAKKTEWSSASKNVVAPEGTVKLQLWITGGVKTLGKCYVDNVKVVRTKKGDGTVASAPAASTTTSQAASTDKPAVVTPTGSAVFSESFEGDLSGWLFNNAYAESNIQVVSTAASNGSKSIYANDDSTEKSPILKSPFITVNPDETYEIFADFKHETGAIMKVWVKYFDSNEKQISNTSFGSNKTSWTTMSTLAVAPSNAAYLQLWITGVNATVGASYIDNIVVTKLSEAEANDKKPATLDKPKVIEGIPADNDKFHIYLCIGQSNMVGADTIKKEDVVVVEGAYLYNGDSKWEVAQPYPVGSGSEYMGFNRYSTVKPGSGRMGPTVGFARGMVTKVPEGVKIGIISNAIGGTTIEQWSKGFEATESRPDNDLYENAVARTKEALAKGGVLKGIIWLQGESCASKAGYMDKLVKVANGLREEIGVKNSEVPFIVSEIPQVRASGVKVLQTAPQHIENSYVVPSTGLTIFDSIHFDADSQRKLGLRMAEIVLDKIYGIKASAEDMYNSIYKNIATAPKEEAAEKKYTILINGAPLTMDVQPIIAGDRLFVPLRAIFEALGAEVLWDDATKTVTGKRSDRTVIMTIGDENAYVNGTQIAMGLAPMIKDSRTLVPVRFVSEGLGATVDWNAETNTASITLK